MNESQARTALLVAQAEVDGPNGARQFIDACARYLGGGFHPDTPFADYVDGRDENKRTFSDREAAQLDEALRIASAYFATDTLTDLYEEAQRAVERAESRQPTCEERIAEHLDGRLGYFDDLVKAADQECICEELREEGEVLEEAPADEEVESHLAGCPLSEDAEYGEESLMESPLAVSPRRTLRIELSTGGPADWLEVDYGAPDEGDEPGAITYHFADWFDHAERELEGSELDRAKAYVERLVGEVEMFFAPAPSRPPGY